MNPCLRDGRKIQAARTPAALQDLLHLHFNRAGKTGAGTVATMKSAKGFGQRLIDGLSANYLNPTR